MAHGKSLELAKITKPAPAPLCGTCGGDFDSHMRKDGKGLLKRYENHRAAGLKFGGITYVKKGNQ